MSDRNKNASGSPVTPSRRDRLRPLELIVFSAILGVFAGGIVLFATREIVLALIFLGVGFIVALVTVALIGLGGTPSEDDLEARKDLEKPDDGTHWH